MVIQLFKWFAVIPLLWLNATEKAVNPAADLHPFYVSVTEINHNNTEKTLEIACKIFTDDLETVINKHSGSKVDLFNTKEKDKAVVDKLMHDYIRENLVIDLDGKKVALEFLGYERESEAIWSYYQVVNISQPKKVSIKNSLLYDAFAEQINLLHVTVNGKRKSTKLNNPESTVQFEF